MILTTNLFRVFAALAFLISLSACSGDKDKDKDALPPDEPVEALYDKAADLMDHGEYHDAATQFGEVERQHPYSQWATKAELMEAFANYQNLDYDAAITSLNQFIELHPGSNDVAYAYYLRALCNYERISDVRRDQTDAKEALKGMQDVISRFPDSPYAKDAALKISLISDHLAGAEMNVGRWYLGQKLYIAAIDRFRVVIDKYQTTSHVPEALERLAECYVALGITKEAKATASVLGYNFPGSDWYKDAYDLLTSNNISPEKISKPPPSAEKLSTDQLSAEKMSEKASVSKAPPPPTATGKDDESWIGHVWDSIF